MQTPPFLVWWEWMLITKTVIPALSRDPAILRIKHTWRQKKRDPGSGPE